MADAPKATRAELIATKGRITLARNGHRLLKKKRDGLIMEFFALLERAKTIREELDRQFRDSIAKLTVARVLEGDVRVRSTALAVRASPAVTIETKSIIGVAVPKITGTAAHTPHSLFDSIAITETAESYERLVELIIVAAEVETAIRKLLVEIEKTKRRVNALEYEIVPRLLRQKAMIVLRLDELERDNFYRLKLSKQRLASDETTAAASQ